MERAIKEEPRISLIAFIGNMPDRLIRGIGPAFFLEGKLSESWKQIDGYPDYLVSDNGRICSLKSGLLKPRENSRGYMIVDIGGDTKRLHRVVAKAFIPNPEEKETVNHKDGNPLNNVAGNLEWCTNSENQRHSLDVLHNSPRKKPVQKCDKNGNVVKEYGSMSEVEKAEGMAKDSLRDVIRRGSCVLGFYYRLKQSEVRS